MKTWKAELLLFLVTFIWGGTFLFTKIGLHDCSPSLFIILRFLIALSLSFIFFGRHLSSLNRANLIHGVILGLFFGGGFVLQTYGLKFTSVSKSAFITGLSVVLTPFAYWFIEKKKILFWQKAGVIVAAIGLWLFTNPRFDSINLGDILTIFSTFFWAFYITYMDVFTRGTKSMAITSQLVIIQLATAAIIALISLLSFDSQNIHFDFSNNLIIALLYNSILASFLLTFIHTGIQKYTTPVKAALIFSLEPVIATSLAVLFINEMLNGREVSGGAILLFGVVVSEVGEFVYGKIVRIFK